MHISMPFGMRRTLYARALTMLGASGGEGRGLTTLAGTVEVELFDAARRAAAAIDDAAVLGAALADGRRRLADAVAPASPLQSWRLVYALLEDSGAATPELPDASPMPVALQLRGFDELLDLDLPAVALRAMSARVERVLATTDADPALRARLEARFAAHTAPVETCLAKAQSWVEAAPDDPAAYLCRFVARVRSGDPTWAAFDAGRALQLAIDPTPLRRELAQELARAETEDPTHAAEWTRLRSVFEERGT